MLLFPMLIVISFAIYAITISKQSNNKSRYSSAKKQHYPSSFGISSMESKNSEEINPAKIKIHPQFKELGIVTIEDLKKVYS